MTLQVCSSVSQVTHVTYTCSVVSNWLKFKSRSPKPKLCLFSNWKITSEDKKHEPVYQRHCLRALWVPIRGVDSPVVPSGRDVNPWFVFPGTADSVSLQTGSWRSQNVSLTVAVSLGCGGFCSKVIRRSFALFYFQWQQNRKKRELELRPLLKAARYLNSVNTCDNVSVSLVCKSMNVEPAFCPLQ